MFIFEKSFKLYISVMSVLLKCTSLAYCYMSKKGTLNHVNIANYPAQTEQFLLYWFLRISRLPYFFGNKTEFCFLQKQSQKSRSILEDGSRSLGLFTKSKTCIIAKFHRTDLVICSHSTERETLSYSQINMVFMGTMKTYQDEGMFKLI